MIGLKRMVLAGAAVAALWALPTGGAVAAAAPVAPAAVADRAAPATAGEALEMQGRRGVRAGGGGFRGGVRGGGRGGFRGRGGGHGGAAAAAVGVGIIGAIIASEAARAHARRECWIERRRVHDDWGRYVGVRRVRVCR